MNYKFNIYDKRLLLLLPASEGWGGGGNIFALCISPQGGYLLSSQPLEGGRGSNYLQADWGGGVGGVYLPSS